jgi:ubiquinone/menaquinone biosynthesis C-methylase UbiE
MDVSRYFEYDKDALLQLRKWLRLNQAPPKTIVEVGCGSGYFTEKLLKMASTSKELVAIEPDDILRKYAEEKLSPKVKFLRGAAEEIPLPDGSADLTVCHIVLNNLPDIYRAVSEMARATKGAGVVAAIEPGGGGISYYPDQKLNELEEKVSEAYGKGIWGPPQQAN